MFLAIGGRAQWGLGPALTINGTGLAAGPKFLSFFPRKPQPSPAALALSQAGTVTRQRTKEAQV